MHQHLGAPLGRNSRPPFLKGPTSSFFFVSTEITGSPRESCSKVLKLGVAVRVFRPRQGLAIGLQAIAHVVEQFGDHAMADPLALQCRRQLTHALAGPAAGTRDPHGWSAPPAGPSPRASSGHARRCASGSRMADAALRGPYGRLAQLPYAAANRPARSSGGPCNRCLATTPGRRRLSGKHQPPHPLVHNGGNRLVTSLNRSFNYHPLSIAEHVVKVRLFRDNSLGGIIYPNSAGFTSVLV